MLHNIGLKDFILKIVTWDDLSSLWLRCIVFDLCVTGSLQGC